MTPRSAPARRELLALGAGAAIALLFPACGGEKDNAGKASPAPRSTAGTAGGPEPVLTGAATIYAAFREELGSGYEVNPPETYGLTSQTYGASGFFNGAEEGERLATAWGYREGYQVALDPDGLLAGLLQGRYFIIQEIHLFSSLDGARQAAAEYAKRYAAVPGSERVDSAPLGHDSSGWQLVRGTVGNSQVVGVYHRFVFRRGTMVAIVQTYGGAPFMTIERARDVAVIIDERALGKRQAGAPTPARTGTPGQPR